MSSNADNVPNSICGKPIIGDKTHSATTQKCDKTHRATNFIMRQKPSCDKYHNDTKPIVWQTSLWDKTHRVTNFIMRQMQYATNLHKPQPPNFVCPLTANSFTTTNLHWPVDVILCGGGPWQADKKNRSIKQDAQRKHSLYSWTLNKNVFSYIELNSKSFVKTVIPPPKKNKLSHNTEQIGTCWLLIQTTFTTYKLYEWAEEYL